LPYLKSHSPQSIRHFDFPRDVIRHINTPCKTRKKYSPLPFPKKKRKEGKERKGKERKGKERNNNNKKKKKNKKNQPT